MPALHPTSKVRESELEGLSNWVHGLAPWSVYFTGTFKGHFTEQAAQRAFERFMRKGYSSVSYFYSIERNPGAHVGHHVHALFADCAALNRKGAWSDWYTSYGVNRIEPVKCSEDVAAYCSKHLVGYLTKEGGWWNFKLASPDLWHKQAKS